MFYGLSEKRGQEESKLTIDLNAITSSLIEKKKTSKNPQDLI